MNRRPDDALRWSALGTDLLTAHIASLSEESARRPSRLPTWTRKHVVAHLNGNAEALCRLAHWARTGEATPMYSSPEQRQADIDAGARMSLADLTAWFDHSNAELTAQLRTLSPTAWHTEVVTAQGRSVPATTIPWLRAREVMVHAVDLGTGAEFSDLPKDFLRALCADIVAKRNSAAPTTTTEMTIQVVDADTTFELVGAPERLTVRGDLAAVTAFLAGRDSDERLTVLQGGSVPKLPRWL